MKTKRIFELKSDRRGLYNKGKKVEVVKKAQPKKKPAPAKDKKK
jgi:hypothetical protein